MSEKFKINIDILDTLDENNEFVKSLLETYEISFDEFKYFFEIINYKYDNGITSEQLFEELNSFSVNVALRNLIKKGYLDYEIKEDGEIYYTLTEKAKNNFNI